MVSEGGVRARGGALEAQHVRGGTAGPDDSNQSRSNQMLSNLKKSKTKKILTKTAPAMIQRCFDQEFDSQ
jgi:hypothetical protein